MPEQVENMPENTLAAMEGDQAAALLLMLISEEQASDILTRLEPDEVKRVGESMYSVTNVGADEINAVFDRFIECAKGRTTVGYRADDQIQGMMKRALGPTRGENMITQIAPQETETNELVGLKWMEATEILTMIELEHPQIKALVLSFLTPEAGAEVLKLMPDDKRGDIIYRLATMRPVSKEAIQSLETLLQNFTSNATSGLPKKFGGTSSAAAIMNNVDKKESQRILSVIKKKEKNTAFSIEELMFIFDDLINMDVKNLGTLMRSIDNETMIPALKGADDKLKDKIFSCMSSRAVQSIQDEMEDRGPMRSADVIAAQKIIIAEAKRLADDGTIMLGDSGDDFV